MRPFAAADAAVLLLLLATTGESSKDFVVAASAEDAEEPKSDERMDVDSAGDDEELAFAFVELPPALPRRVGGRRPREAGRA